MIPKKKLSDICDIVKGNVTITKVMAGEYPLVTTAEERSTSNEFQFDCKAVCIPLVSSTGHGDASLKRIHYQEGKFALGRILCAVIPKDETVVNARYLYIFLSYFKDDLIVPLMKGSANVSLTIKALSTVEVALPPIEKQLEIVEMVNVIENTKSTIDESISSERNRVKLLREQILQLAISGKLVPQDDTDEPASVLIQKIKAEKEQLIKNGEIRKQKELPPVTDVEKPFEIPSSWEWVRLGNITIKIGAGSTPTGGKSVYKDDGIKFIRSQNVYNDGLRIDDIAYIDEKINSKMKGSIVKPQDILLNITGGSIGRCTLVADDFDVANVNQHVTIIRLYDLNMRKYIHSCAISSYIQKLIMDVQVGVSREGLSAEKLSNFLIPLLPLAEQQRIVARVDELFALCGEIEGNIDRSSKYSQMLMKAVLQVQL